MFMNEHDVRETLANVHECHEVEEVPNLYTAARILDALVEWTNSHSDGWPYWQKPSQAASTLMQAFHDRDYALRFGQERDGSPLTDVDEAALAAMLRPIKAFLTKQKVDWHADLPWAALFPAA
jgi:hypothetical protein